jgi:hypothetical protein
MYAVFKAFYSKWVLARTQPIGTEKVSSSSNDSEFYSIGAQCESQQEH